MKKPMLLLVLALSVLIGRAQADTTELYTSGCANTRICINVGNSADVAIALYAMPSYPYVTLIVEGKSYFSATGNGEVISALLLTAQDGSVLTLNATFSGYRHLVNSGRLHQWVTTWTLVEGAIEGLDVAQ